MPAFVITGLQADFEKRVNPNDKGQQALLEEMRAHVKKVHLFNIYIHDDPMYVEQCMPQQGTCQQSHGAGVLCSWRR